MGHGWHHLYTCKAKTSTCTSLTDLHLQPSNSRRRARKWGQHSDLLQAASSSSPSTVLDQPGTVFVRLPEHHWHRRCHHHSSYSTSAPTCLLLTCADHSAVCPKERHKVPMHGPEQIYYLHFSTQTSRSICILPS